jgi:uncharacterized membrane protein YdjX (TVP38/TMEM64 family)
MNRKLLLLIAVGVVVLGFFALGLDDYLTLDQLKASQTRFAELLALYPALVPAAYFIIYVLVTALSLPGAAIMTLAGGALFGLWQAIGYFFVLAFVFLSGLLCFYAADRAAQRAHGRVGRAHRSQ